MSFPLGSLTGAEDTAPADKVYKRQSKKAKPAPAPASSSLRTPLWLVLGGLVWCLVLLALLTHDPSDAAFSIAGSKEQVSNRVGTLGAWVSDLLLFGFGYSAWWLMLVALRRWLGGLADVLRTEPVVDETPVWQRRGLWLLGLVLLMCASCALEWTRLYGWESRLPGQHAGGVLGYALGPLSMKLLGFAGSGLVWIVALLAGSSLALQFSWMRLAELIGTLTVSLF